MGSTSSQDVLEGYDFPTYYVSHPAHNLRKAMVLDQSLTNLIHGCKSPDATKNKRIPFTKFYSVFFDSLANLEKAIPPEGHVSVGGYFDGDIEGQSLFLVRLMKLVVDAPKHTLLQRRSGKWQPEARKALKRFISDYWGIDLLSFSDIGEAIFHAIRACDDLYTHVLKHYWIEAYSSLLQQTIPIIVGSKVRNRRGRVLSLSDFSDVSEIRAMYSPPATPMSTTSSSPNSLSSSSSSSRSSSSRSSLSSGSSNSSKSSRSHSRSHSRSRSRSFSRLRSWSRSSRSRSTSSPKSHKRSRSLTNSPPGSPSVGSLSTGSPSTGSPSTGSSPNGSPLLAPLCGPSSRRHSPLLRTRTMPRPRSPIINFRLPSPLHKPNRSPRSSLTKTPPFRLDQQPKRHKVKPEPEPERGPEPKLEPKYEPVSGNSLPSTNASPDKEALFTFEEFINCKKPSKKSRRTFSDLGRKLDADSSDHAHRRTF